MKKAVPSEDEDPDMAWIHSQLYHTENGSSSIELAYKHPHEPTVSALASALNSLNSSISSRTRFVKDATCTLSLSPWLP